MWGGSDLWELYPSFRTAPRGSPSPIEPKMGTPEQLEMWLGEIGAGRPGRT